MKKIFASILLLIIELGMFAQTPPSFNYQAILRDASGNVLANKEVNIGIVILQGNTTGNQVFTETHPVTTNEFGLVNLQIGSVNTAEIQAIDWDTGPYFIQISVDGTAMGTSQLLSVPFAMHAITVENDAVDDDDANPENEIQVLSINADTIYLSNGGFVVLPPETDPAFTNWDKSAGISISEAQISDLKHFTGDSITGNETVFDGWDKNADDDFTTADETDPVFSSSLAAEITPADTTLWAKDTDPQNELQNLKLENQQLSISDGNTIDLSGAYYIADSSATNELQDITLNGTQLSITKGSTVDLASLQDGTGTDNQTISLYGNQLVISNGNRIYLPYIRTEGDSNPFNEIQTLSIANDTISLSRDGGQVKLPAETDPLFTAWDKSTGIEITEAQITDLKHFTNADEIDPVYAADSASIKNGITKNQQAIIDTASLLRSDLATKVALADTAALLHSETVQNQQSIIDTAAQIRADMLTTELDPVFSSWDKSTGIEITESQITDLKHFTNADEIDPVYAADSASIKNVIEKNGQGIIDTAALLRSDLATKVTLADTATLLHSETAQNQQAIIDTAAKIRDDMFTTEIDPIYNASAASQITSSDISNWDKDNDSTNELELPLQTGNAGKYLTTDGSSTSWESVSTGSGSVGSLDDAYNNGNTIITDSNTPVIIEGKGGLISTYNNHRMMWLPSDGAFRAGIVDGTEWDENNIGWCSFATGRGTTASGYFAVAIGSGSTSTEMGSVAVGSSAKAIGRYSTALGFTKATGEYSTAVGQGATASGFFSTAVGQEATANGEYSMALNSGETNAKSAIAIGSNANANLEGSFVYSLDGSDPYTATAPYSFNVQATGGVKFTSSYSNASLEVGVILGSDQSSWASISDSTKKENFLKADGEYFLKSIEKLKLGSWNYKGQTLDFRHYGPMAQEIYHYFGADSFGTIGCDTLLNSADMDGIMLIGIQALEKRTTDAKEKITELSRKNTEQEAKITALQQTIKNLQNTNTALKAEKDSKIEGLQQRLETLEALVKNTLNAIAEEKASVQK